MSEYGEPPADDGAPGSPTSPTSSASSASVLSSSAVMAAGTIVSRLSGFVRGTLLAAALGAGLHADVFNIANTVPNMLYILLAGGVVNAVLVPQLVRAMEHDPDRGAAYTDRVITLAALFLGGVTILLVVAAPWLVRLFLDDNFFDPGCRGLLDSVIDFARYCLPQVFFYGMFVLVGQVLNARGRFGPMMWAPIANNVVAAAVLTTYLAVIGPGSTGGFSPAAEALLGLGSTFGIVVQFVVLLPYLRAAGVRFRPRLDLRGSGLGHTARLGVWTVLFVVVNQVAYTVVVRLASSGTVGRCGQSVDAGTGYTVYANSFLLAMLPHSVITVSLATAVLPLLSSYAARGDLASVGRTVSSTLRSAYALVVPAAAVLAVSALEVSHVVYGYGAASRQYRNFAPSVALFGLGLVLFTAHYVALRGFYAMEHNRRVFLIQCAIAATNVVAAVALVRGASAAQTAPRLVLAYSASYAVGATLSLSLLSRAVGGLQGRVLVRFLVRLGVAAGLSTALAWAARLGLVHLLPAGLLGAVVALLGTGLVFGAAYLALARAMRISEVTDVLALVTRRLRPRDLR